MPPSTHNYYQIEETPQIRVRKLVFSRKEDPAARQKVVDLKEKIDANCDPSTSLAIVEE
jgi:hypothetical protein